MTASSRTLSVIVLVLALLAGAFASGAALAAKVYKWVDENGVTHYGDAIPPEYSKKQHDVLDKQGTRVETVNAEEDRPTGPAGAQPEGSRDRALLATYGSVEEIEQVRDRRIGYLDSQNQVAEDRLASLRARLGELEAGGDQNELATVRQRITEYEAEIGRRNEEKARIAASFDDDIRRFRELRGLDGE